MVVIPVGMDGGGSVVSSLTLMVLIGLTSPAGVDALHAAVTKLMARNKMHKRPRIL